MPALLTASASNAFQQTMLGLEFTPDPVHPADLFSQACIEQYREADPQQFGYLFAQVFEPDVLREVALLEGVEYEAVAALAHRPTPTLVRLAELVDCIGDLPVVSLIHLAAALVSVSRFTVANRILAEVANRTVTVRDAFEATMLEFVTSNRSEDGAASRRAFAQMRIALETGEVPPDRAMDACAQAVVWYLKRRELSNVDYEWYLARGTELAEASDQVDPAVLSSWYRGVAMVPAARGDVESTHTAMERARDAALVTLSHRPRAYEMHLMKTYYESSLKEHMYLTRDVDRAEESGRALIAVDPAWAPSYGELAEAYLAFGRPEPAAELFETAVSIGPPYVGHHRLQAARCHQKLGHDEEALEHYLALVLPEGTSPAVVLAALSLAEKTDHPARHELAAALAATGPVGSER